MRKRPVEYGCSSVSVHRLPGGGQVQAVLRFCSASTGEAGQVVSV